MLCYAIFGLPGAGKGTIAGLLEKEMKIKQLSTGEILREEVKKGSALGQEVKRILESGDLVSDQTMTSIIKNKLDRMSQSVMFDGFPRTLEQAEALDRIVPLKKVFFLKVTDETAINRLLNRGNDRRDKRSDDEIEVIKNRLRVFYIKTQPLIDYYLKKNILVEIDGSQPIAAVFQETKTVLNEK